MALKQSQSIIRFFSIFLIFLSESKVFACAWSVNFEITRIAMFRAERSNYQKLNSFLYTSNLYNTSDSVSERDQQINCEEWQTKMGKNIATIDIFRILYQTESEIFELAYNTHTLDSVFKNNTFIQVLLQDKNKPILEYLAMAKKLEYNTTIHWKWESWDYWDYSNTAYRKKAIFKAPTTTITLIKDEFLKYRYAFLMMRQAFYSDNHDEVINIYEKYFAGNNSSILKHWATYYMAMSVNDQVKSNYYLSKAFDFSDDKAFPATRHFDLSLTQKTLLLAKNNREKGIIIGMASLRNPGPALDNLEKIFRLIPNDELFSFLVTREINKLEDWIFTPQFSSEGPSISSDDNWYIDYEKAKRVNLKKDITYLKKLKSFLMKAHLKATGEQKDFLAISIAHLSFMDDDIETGRKYQQLISRKANASIQIQQSIQMALLTISNGNIRSDSVKQCLWQCFNKMEALADTDRSYFKTIQSVLRIIGTKFIEQGDAATGGLLYLKSDLKAELYENFVNDYDFYENEKYYYSYIGYFDRLASEQDMMNLIHLIEKKKKTSFEKYIIEGTTTRVDVYRDLYGTIAFRNNHLQTAYETFSKISPKFWSNHYDYFQYLDSDPFFPSILNQSYNNYKFNKPNFIKTLINLESKQTAESYLKLGHAYFNISYWGNSWMMVSYDWSVNMDDYYLDAIYGRSGLKLKESYQSGNYLNCNLAKDYYKKALALSNNKEDKALAALMIFECEYYQYCKTINAYDVLNPIKFRPGREIIAFNSMYKNTEIYRLYSCPLTESFIK